MKTQMAHSQLGSHQGLRGYSWQIIGNGWSALKIKHSLTRTKDLIAKCPGHSQLLRIGALSPAKKSLALDAPFVKELRHILKK